MRSIYALQDIAGWLGPESILAPGQLRQRRAVHEVRGQRSPHQLRSPVPDQAAAAEPGRDAREGLERRTNACGRRSDEQAPDASFTALVITELRRALGALEHSWLHVVTCHGRVRRVDADDQSDRRRNQLVRPIDEVVKRDPWSARRVSGRGQAGAALRGGRAASGPVQRRRFFVESNCGLRVSTA